MDKGFSIHSIKNSLISPQGRFGILGKFSPRRGTRIPTEWPHSQGSRSVFPGFREFRAGLGVGLDPCVPLPTRIIQDIPLFFRHLTRTPGIQKRRIQVKGTKKNPPTNPRGQENSRPFPSCRSDSPKTHSQPAFPTPPLLVFPGVCLVFLWDKQREGRSRKWEFCFSG